MALRRELLISAGPGEWRAAWLEDDAVAELHVERGDIRPPGSLHLGRIVRRVASLDAVLVDIGEERLGLLPLRAAATEVIGVEEGARVVVQIRREAQPDKGALLSAPIERDLAELTGLAAAHEVPRQIEPRPGFAAALGLRLPAPPRRIITDDVAVLRDLREAFPEAEITQQGVADWPFDLDGLFDGALAPLVPLPGGGRIHIAETAAAVLIDVDSGTQEGAGSGQRTALKTNLAAVGLIARQLRLRQLGGGIIIDFVGLDSRRARERVREAMAAALRPDPARPRVLGWTQLAHLELVRPRRLRSLGAAMLAPGEVRKSPTTLAFEALRRLHREARANPAANWRLTAAPAVEAALRGPAAAALRDLETRLGRKIALAAAQRGESDPFDIAPI